MTHGTVDMARWRPTIEIKAGGHQIGSGFLFNRKRDGHAIPTAIITLFRPARLVHDTAAVTLYVGRLLTFRNTCLLPV